MSRPLRIQYEGAFYHALNRGIEKRKIFLDNKDYEAFLSICESLCERYQFLLHSYCLMPNHYHLYIETPLGNLSVIMRGLNGQYTQYFNRRYYRVGPLFQGRYKAILVDKENYSLQVSRYIHLNPVKEKIVSDPARYQWSSYAAFMNGGPQKNFLKTQWLLSQFGPPTRTARAAFQRFTMEGLKDVWDPSGGAIGGSLLGNSAFIDQAQKEWVPKTKNSSISRLREIQKPVETGEIESIVDKMIPDPVLKRKFLIYSYKKFTPLTLKEIAKKAGGMSISAVCQVVKRLEMECDGNERLLGNIIKLKDLFCQM